MTGAAHRALGGSGLGAIDPNEIALIVIAKEPIPGRCKTRLCPALDPVQAAALAEAALADTLETLAATPARRRVVALDGAPGGWLPPGLEVEPQGDGDLGARLATAFETVGGPALLVGMDTPQLRRTDLTRAVALLAAAGVDAVLGGAEDGGYWAIGLRQPNRAVFRDVPMSSGDTASAQRTRLRGLGMRWLELETMRDVDTIADVQAVAAMRPRSRFARAFAQLQPPGSQPQLIGATR